MNSRRLKMMENLRGKTANGNSMGSDSRSSAPLKFKDVLPLPTSSPTSDPYRLAFSDDSDEENTTQTVSGYPRQGDKEKFEETRHDKRLFGETNKDLAQDGTVPNAEKAPSRTDDFTATTSHSARRPLDLKNKYTGIIVKRKLFSSSAGLRRLKGINPKPRQERSSLRAKLSCRKTGGSSTTFTNPTAPTSTEDRAMSTPEYNGNTSTPAASIHDPVISSILSEDGGCMPPPPTVAQIVHTSTEDVDMQSEEQQLITLTPSETSRLQSSSEGNRQTPATAPVNGTEREGLTSTRTPVTPPRRTATITAQDEQLNFSPIIRQLNARMQDTQQEADPVTPPKRRRANPQQWKKQQAKIANNAGKVYVSVRGKVVPAKKIGPGCGLQCNKKCSSAITEDQRQRIFINFWELGSPALRWQYIAGRITTSSVKRRTVGVLEGEKQRRNNTNTYNFLVDSRSVPVCQKMFLDTLAISRQTVATAMKKAVASDGAVLQDGRGRKKEIKSLLREKKIKDVTEHIKQFPRVPGHFTRQDSSVFYLDSGLNIRKMHSMYVFERQAQGQTNITSLAFYRKVFRQFKLKFLLPKKDQCAQCLSFKNKTPQEKSLVTDEHREHLKRALVSRATKKLDSMKARRNKQMCVASFDLQSVLQCPKGENADFYYHRKLHCFNYTIYDAGKGQGYCYFWSEITAKRGSNEITSFLNDFIRSRCAEGVQEFRFYSDNCYGQNKNRALYSLYYFLCQELKVNIKHIYLEKGHTQMECDSMHAAIERRSKRMTIFTPSQWCATIQMAKLTSPRYEVKQVTQQDIYDVKALAALLNWKKVPTSNLREINFQAGNPAALFRVRFGEALQSEKIVTKNTPATMPTLQLAYGGRLPLKPNKQKDLNWLLDNGHIEKSSEHFYVDLKEWAQTLGRTSNAGADDSSSEGSDKEE